MRVFAAKFLPFFWMRNNATLHAVHRRSRQGLATKTHEYTVKGHVVQPRGKCRLSAIGGDLAIDLKKHFLSEILGLSRVAHQVKTLRVYAATSQTVDLLERGCISSLCVLDESLGHCGRR